MTAINMNDTQAIVGIVEHYIEGARSERSAEMKQVFNRQATVFGYAGNDLFAGSISELYDWHDANGPAQNLSWQITSIDVVGTVAVVRIEIDDWTGLRFTDFLSMLKVTGEWQVVNKVFHLHALNSESSALPSLVPE